MRRNIWPIRVVLEFSPEEAAAYAKLCELADVCHATVAQVAKSLAIDVVEEDWAAHNTEAECAWRVH